MPRSRIPRSLLAASLIGSPALADAAWRFQFTGPYASHRGAVGSDGTVYMQDVTGVLFALSPEGAPRWTYDPAGAAEGPVCVGPDGTIYISANPVGADVQIHAVNPDGSQRWVFSDPGVTQGIIAGPGVGPDGNIYAITEVFGLGALSLTPQGALRWNDRGDPAFNERGQTGVELSFGSHLPAGPLDRVFFGFDMNGTGTATGRLFAYSLGGERRFDVPLGGDANVGQFQPAAGAAAGAVYVASLFSAQGYRLRSFNADTGSLNWSYPPDNGPPTNTLTQPAVGPDGVVYVMRNLGEVHAVNADGSNRWTHAAPLIFNAPVASPANNAVVVGGRITFGEPGFVRALDPATGATLWTVDLPDEGGVRMIPFSRPWFSPDGRRAYITTTLPGSSQSGYLYAFDLPGAAPCPGDANGDGAVNFADLNIVLSQFGQSGAGLAGDVTGDGAVTFADLNVVLGAFGATC